MSVTTDTDWTSVIPEGPPATRPAEHRGLARDAVRLVVADTGGEVLDRFHGLPRFLRAGDLLVVNTSATVPAAVDGTRADGTPVVVHLSTRLDDGHWVVELRSAPDAATPLLTADAGERVTVTGGAGFTLVGGHPHPVPGGVRLWRAVSEVDLGAHLTHRGRPISYGHTTGRWPLAAYQTVYARTPGSAEMPSAGRPFTHRLLTALTAAGVRTAPVTLHCGVSSPEAGEPPCPERFEVPPTTAALIEHTRADGGRVIAVGTTVVRAVESAVADGRVDAAAGWTDLVLGPGRPTTAVTGVISGLHTPGASHLDLLAAVVGADTTRRAHLAAAREHLLWHEFGDSTLLLR